MSTPAFNQRSQYVRSIGLIKSKMFFKNAEFAPWEWIARVYDAAWFNRLNRKPVFENQRRTNTNWCWVLLFGQIMNAIWGGLIKSNFIDFWKKIEEAFAWQSSQRVLILPMPSTTFQRHKWPQTKMHKISDTKMCAFLCLRPVVPLERCGATQSQKLFF